jgi:hypothetical protein
LRIARGISRLGESVSSPREAAPSKPPNDRNPNTAALATADTDVPGGSLNASTVIVCPFGEEPAISLTTITTMRIRISVTEMPSTPSSERVATRMSPNARNAISTAAISAITR